MSIQPQETTQVTVSINHSKLSLGTEMYYRKSKEADGHLAPYEETSKAKTKAPEE